MKTIALFLIALVGLFAAPGIAAAQQGTACTSCHGAAVTKLNGSLHASLACEACHDSGTAGHLAAPGDPAQAPRVRFDMEVCGACHADQYNTFEVVSRGRTFYGGSDNGAL